MPFLVILPFPTCSLWTRTTVFLVTIRVAVLLEATSLPMTSQHRVACRRSTAFQEHTILWRFRIRQLWCGISNQRETLQLERIIHSHMEHAPGGRISAIISCTACSCRGGTMPMPGNGLSVPRNMAGMFLLLHRSVPLSICNLAPRGRTAWAMWQSWRECLITVM